MSRSELSPAQSRMKLMMWNAEVESFDSIEFYNWLQDLGLSNSIVSRLHELISKTMQVGKTLISMGKVILFKIIKFVKENPCLVAGAGIGTVIGVAIF